MMTFATFAVISGVMLQSQGIDERDLSELVERLRDTDVRRAKCAADTLGNMGAEAKAAVPALIAILGDRKQNYNLRIHVSIALEKIGPDAEAAIPVFVRMLRDKKEDP
jgi:HEAT repeat protein